jgi:aryl-alcohol dehydrogenase-like predicted oxidoreductase|tara:strand:+ start:2554 stop:3534 length:981 start_codon:yes stop_codon:yes gene_type:complete
MRNITLGRTGAEVSAISLGTWSYGGANKSGKLPVGWADQSDDDSRLALQRAWEVGINHWDTADVYGNGRSEQIIGSMWGSVPRKDIFIATKVGWDRGFQKHWYNTGVMRQNMERSLINLKTDCVDLIYLHHCNFGENEEYFDEAIEVIRKFKKEGKTKFIGLSDWSSKKIMQFIERCDPDVVQPLRNVLDDTYESSGLKNYVDDHNLGICFFSPIKHGLLTGKYTQPTQFSDGDFRSHEKAFSDMELIEKMRINKTMLESRFPDHPNPVLYGVLSALFTDSPTGCALLGQRNVAQVEMAATLGDLLSNADTEWVKTLYSSCKYSPT